MSPAFAMGSWVSSYFGSFGRSFLTSRTKASASIPKPCASMNAVSMLGWRLARSSSETVVGCKPARSARASWVSPFSFRMRSKTWAKASVMSKPTF